MLKPKIEPQKLLEYKPQTIFQRIVIANLKKVGRFPKDLFQEYTNQLRYKNPIKTKLFTAMISFSVSDIVC